MHANIHAIFFDVGGTLRTRVRDAGAERTVFEKMLGLLESDEEPERFCARLEERYSAYRKWRQETLLEASEEEIWAHWMLPDLPRELVCARASELTDLWRERNGRHVFRPEAAEVITELARRGYILGIISNTIGSRELPRALEALGLAPYFSVIMLSSIFGRRKPDPGIFWEATRHLGVDAHQSAHLGDRPSQDIAGAKRAGFAASILLRGQGAAHEEGPEVQHGSDAVVDGLGEVLDMFHRRSPFHPRG